MEGRAAGQSWSQGVRVAEGSLPDNGTFEEELTAKEVNPWRAGGQGCKGRWGEDTPGKP